jgi:hypothetical protein
MENKYFFIVTWGEISSGSGAAAASFQCGAADDLTSLGRDFEEEWGDGESEAIFVDEVEILDRSNDEITHILGRGGDYDAVSKAFYRVLRENFSGHLGV